MKTECIEQAVIFPDLISRPVVVEAAATHVSSDGGSVLLGQLDRSFGYTRRFAGCFTDLRAPALIEHDLLTMLRQRVYGIALGYEDLNDHDQLRGDPLLAAVCGQNDVEGRRRRDENDKGKPLAGKSTLNRLELPLTSESEARYRKIGASPEKIEEFFIKEFVRSIEKGTQRIVLDLDLTENPLYGEQEGRFFHGYYDSYCYLPLYIFCGHWPVVARLRTADQDHSEDTVATVAKVVQAVRAKFPGMKIVIRADSGFCRNSLMSWCEDHQVQYVLGLARNKVLQRILRGTLRQAKSMLEYNQSEKERLFKDFRYGAKSWGKTKRRVVGKAEWTSEGANPRFIITNISQEEIPAQDLYEKEYCIRGDMENRIKEQHLDLRADRTSTHLLVSNQLRLWFSTLAYLIMNQLRARALVGTELAKATCGTIRLKLFKIGAVVRMSVRRILVSLSAHHPMRSTWYLAAQKLFTIDTT